MIEDWEQTKKAGSRIPKMKWDSNTIELVQTLLPFFSDKELSKLLGRSPKTIEHNRRRYGILRDVDVDYKALLRKTPVLIIRPRSEYDELRKSIN